MTTTIIPARERAQAPIGLPYIAPLMAHAWFRCDLTGETCYTVEFTDKIADNLLDHGTSGVAVSIIEKLLRARESLLGRIYVPGSIKHYELVEG